MDFGALKTEIQSMRRWELPFEDSFNANIRLDHEGYAYLQFPGMNSHADLREWAELIIFVADIMEEECPAR